jgi:xanthine dehydrogenase small subunit
MVCMEPQARLFTLTRMASDSTRTIRFFRRGEIVSLGNVSPTRTLLEVLREDLGCTGTKEGCGEGDCGACTVVLAEPAQQGLRYRAINSCIRLAHSVHGLALWTVEDLAQDGLHPVQQALVDSHATQCGFCTPGFVMSLFAMYQGHVLAGRSVTRELAQRELSGNLCRCTGYRPILDAAQRMAELPPVHLDEAAVRAGLARIDQAAGQPQGAYLQPDSLDALLRLRAEHPQAQLVAGCTDVGLWITKQHREFAQVLDLTRVAELRALQWHGNLLRIGAAVPLEDAFAELVRVRPELQAFAARFAGLPVRNSGTLGGNVANGSPIGDAMPLLIALGARLVLASVRGEREMAVEDFYTGYRKNLLAPDELLAFIDLALPAPAAGDWLRAYKISKRYDDDISAVCLAVQLRIEGGQVAQVSIGAGGVAATPVRARQTEAALRGQPWCAATVAQAQAVLRGEFQPISDMRASAAYRLQVLGNLLQRLWLETQGATAINLESVEELA